MHLEPAGTPCKYFEYICVTNLRIGRFGKRANSLAPSPVLIARKTILAASRSLLGTFLAKIASSQAVAAPRRHSQNAADRIRRRTLAWKALFATLRAVGPSIQTCSRSSAHHRTASAAEPDEDIDRRVKLITQHDRKVTTTNKIQNHIPTTKQ